MKKALCMFINTEYLAVGKAIGGPMGKQINDITVHDSERGNSKRGYTVYYINLSTIEELIERGIITANALFIPIPSNMSKVVDLTGVNSSSDNHSCLDDKPKHKRGKKGAPVQTKVSYAYVILP
jgi:hypothetical protein